MMNKKKIYPRTGDHETIYLKNVITNPNIIVGITLCIMTLSLILLYLKK